MSLEGKRVLVFGGSKNIGYHTSVRLLAHGATVTFLLRNPSTFDNDGVIKSYLSSGKVRFAIGDALNVDDVANAWIKAVEDDPTSSVDFVIFTIGALPNKISLIHGATMEKDNLCTHASINVLSTMPNSEGKRPKFIFVTASGITKASYNKLPIPVKIFYTWMLDGPHGPHLDKLGMERVIYHSAGKEWVDNEPPEEIIKGSENQISLPESGQLKEWIIVRPTLLTDGRCKADEPAKGKAKEPYRILDRDAATGYTVSRRDVAHFIADKAILDWEKYSRKTVEISY